MSRRAWHRTGALTDMHGLCNNAEFREKIRPEGVGPRGAFEVAHSESLQKSCVCKATSRFGETVDEWHAVLMSVTQWAGLSTAAQ